jgi:hypothetical protein
MFKELVPPLQMAQKRKHPAGTESHDVGMSKIIPREIDLSNPEKDKCTTKTSDFFPSFFGSVAQRMNR